MLWQHVLKGAEPTTRPSTPGWSATVCAWRSGFLIDRLTAMMMAVVTFVSLMVHIYTIGYMAHEEGYQRFFSYIALFTFSMLMLVMSNNFLQLFFGWEAGRPGVVPADRFLFQEARDGDFRQHEGFSWSTGSAISVSCSASPRSRCTSAAWTTKRCSTAAPQFADKTDRDLGRRCAGR